MAIRPSSAGSSRKGEDKLPALKAAAIASLSEKNKHAIGDPNIGLTLMKKMGDKQRDDIKTVLCLKCWKKECCPIHNETVVSGYIGRDQKIRTLSTKALHHIQAAEGQEVSNMLVQNLKEYQVKRGKGKGKGRASSFSGRSTSSSNGKGARWVQSEDI